VPAGTEFAVRLNNPLGSNINTPGELISAEVSSPIVDDHGQTFVPVGARVEGRVVRVTSQGAPSIQLDLYSIDTAHGRMPLKATARRDQPGGGFSADEIYQPGLDYNVVLIPPRQTTQPGVGGGPVLGGQAPAAQGLQLPAGSPIHMVLVRPLTWPPQTTQAPSPTQPGQTQPGQAQPKNHTAPQK
jgi:hypothetical protein